MISIQGLSKRFGSLDVLNCIRLEFKQGESYALIGPNGSGKTTLIKCLLGMVIPDQGEIQVEGKSIRGRWDYRKSIGYMPQIGRYPDNITIGQLFTMMKDLRSDCELTDEELVEEFGLHCLLYKKMHTLSGGTRQKVSAALAFMFSPKLLILDEPTAGLDPIAVEVMKEKIFREMALGKTFIITSHILSDLDQLADHAIYLDNGTVVYNDTIEELKAETGELQLGRAIAAVMKRNIKGVHV